MDFCGVCSMPSFENCRNLMFLTSMRIPRECSSPNLLHVNTNNLTLSRFFFCMPRFFFATSPHNYQWFMTSSFLNHANTPKINCWFITFNTVKKLQRRNYCRQKTWPFFLVTSIFWQKNTQKFPINFKICITMTNLNLER